MIMFMFNVDEYLLFCFMYWFDDEKWGVVILCLVDYDEWLYMKNVEVVCMFL